MKLIEFKNFSSCTTAQRERAEEIYLASFPACERRPVADLRERIMAGEIECVVAMAGERAAGFATVWRLPRAGWAYVEHLAVDAELRGAGLGSAIIRRLQCALGCPIVLEVEPWSQGAAARRRIGFYERLGFTAHHAHPYVQPPYAPGLPAVPLTLMTWGRADAPLAELAAELRARVYGA